MPADLEQVVHKAVALDKWSLGRLVSMFEDTRASAARDRKRVMEHLAGSARRTARFVGITGTPGSGKSTLIGALATRLAAGEGRPAVAVLAVDPSSHVSGGALLGDRTRVRFPADEARLFFRSQAAGGELGGVGRSTFQVCRVLEHLFDFVFIETVGIGQSEVEIQHVADRVYLVLQPLGGDQVQFMKAGIMEIPDAFILNKCDQTEAAERSYHQLVSSLGLARIDLANEARVHRVSAHTGAGIDEVVAELQGLSAGVGMASKVPYFFERWVRDEYGRIGTRFLGARTAVQRLAAAGGFDEAQAVFDRDYRLGIASQRPA